jgi:hypothetical protein
MNKFEQNFTRVLKCHETEVNEGNLQVIDRLKKLEQLKRQKKQQLDFQRMVSIRSSRYL